MNWEVAFPPGIVAREVTPPSDSPYSTISLARGWIGDHAVTIVVTTRPRRGVTLRSEARRLGGGDEGTEIAVEGAKGARRVDRDLENDEGVSPDDGLERMTLVVAAGRRDMLALVIRVPRRAPVRDAVDTLVASLRVENFGI